MCTCTEWPSVERDVEMSTRLQVAQMPSRTCSGSGRPGGEHGRSKSFIHRAPKSRTDDDMTAQHVSILEKFAAEAIRLGAEQLEVEYKDGYEELSAIAGDFGFGIGRLRSTGQDAATTTASASKPIRSDCAAPEDSPSVSGLLQHA